MRALNTAILSSISLTALMASPANAQVTPAAPVDTTPQKTQESEQSRSTTSPTNAEGQPAATTPATRNGDSIIVTGSRIRRNNFTTPQNVDVVTRDDQILAGTRSTADTLQSATITSGTSQINGSFLGYLSDNGQAASTVGLRGLGSTRTLVLLNGRRLAPAGVGPQLVAADLNVLPTAIVQRIEVLREGASSIYGSDAIAGVINIITDSSINGITVDAFADQPLYAKEGQTLRGSISAGRTFSRGHFLASVEVRDDRGMRLGDRADTSCPRELAYVNGVEVGQTVPGGTGLRCFPFQRGGGGTARGYGVLQNWEAGLFNRRATFAGYLTNTPNIASGPIDVTNSFNARPLASPTELQDTVFSPIRTYTAYANGAYELEALGDAELYGEALFTRRKSHQESHTQLNFQRVPNRFTTAQLYGGSYFGTPVEQYGYPVSPFFPTAWAAAGVNYFGPFIVPSRTLEDKQRVDYFRANGGLRGRLGLGDWRYDANIQISRTKGVYDLQTPIAEQLGNTLVAVAAPSGTPSQYITVGIPGQTGAGNSYTCASNVTGGAYNGGTCVPINFYDPEIAYNGFLPDALFNYIYPTINYTTTKYRQNTFSLGLDGTLFNLPGGPVKAAVGVEHRRDHLNDQPGAERAAGELLNFGTASPTIGSDQVTEAYAELNVPILKDRPFVNLLEVDGSGRYTHYKSYGSDFTYHLSGQWAPVSALRFRGNYGTNFRAPNLYEQYVADEVGFYGAALDPCAEFGTRYAPGDTVYQNCLAALTPILGANAVNFAPPGGSIQVTTTGGHGLLKAEKAKTYGFGTVITVPPHIADFSLAVDYWHVKVKGEVGTLGNLILNFCYEATDFPNNPYCALIGPRLTAAQVPVPGQAGTIGSFQNPYLNISQQIASGIDFDARYAARVFGGQFSTQLQATRNIHQKLEYFPGQGLTEYNGTLGYPGQNGGPKWVATLDTRFKTSNNITVRWGAKYVGPSESEPNNITIGGQPATFDLKAERYWEHGASVQVLWKDIGQITVGMNNIFNAKPPTISDDRSGFPRIGNFFANGPYDYRGRSVFVNITRTFKPFS
jgi:iron complex outermembrane receptor protein